MGCFQNGINVIINSITLLGDLILCGVARITSCPGHDIEITPGAGGITKIGDLGATSHGLSSVGDLFISGNLEVDVTLFADSGILVPDNKSLAFGASVDSQLRYSTVQTPASMLLTVGANSNILLLVQTADMTFNFNHALELDPTLIGHSRNQNTTEWFKRQHNTVDALLGIGKGGHVTQHETPIDLANDAFFDLPNASAGFGTLIVGDGEEFTHWHWTSAGVVTLVNETANVVNTDTNLFFCIFDNGTAVRVRNRLGSAKKVVFDYHFTTP